MAALGSQLGLGGVNVFEAECRRFGEVLGIVRLQSYRLWSRFPQGKEGWGVRDKTHAFVQNILF